MNGVTPNQESKKKWLYLMMLMMMVSRKLFRVCVWPLVPISTFVNIIVCVCAFFFFTLLCANNLHHHCVFFIIIPTVHTNQPPPSTTIFFYTLINWKWMKPNTPTNFSWPGHKTNNTYMYTRVCADRNKKIISVIDDARCCLFVFFLFTPTLYSYLEIWHLKPGFFQV